MNRNHQISIRNSFSFRICCKNECIAVDIQRNPNLAQFRITKSIIINRYYLLTWNWNLFSIKLYMCFSRLENFRRFSECFGITYDYVEAPTKIEKNINYNGIKLGNTVIIDCLHTPSSLTGCLPFHIISIVLSDSFLSNEFSDAA